MGMLGHIESIIAICRFDIVFALRKLVLGWRITQLQTLMREVQCR